MFDTAARLFDLMSLLLVGFGTALVVAMRSTGEDLRRAVCALEPLLRARPSAEALSARRDLRRIEAAARLKGLAAADRLKLENAFARRALLRLLDDGGSFASWSSDELQDRAARHDAAQSVWRAAADAAPAMGMIGTVIGLIGMFAAMDDPETIGASMALAMLTTLYGLLLGPVAAHSIAARLERLSAVEQRWQRSVLTRLETLSEVEPPSMVDLVNTLRAAE